MTSTAVGPSLRGPAVELFRHLPKPILSTDDWPYPAGAVFNPGAVIHNGQTLLLCRVEDRRGISHLTVARSDDGRTGWMVDREPLLATGDDPQSRYGIEDPRITWVEEIASYVIAYVQRGPQGLSVALAITRDFHLVERIGTAMPAEDGNAALLPRHVGGRFILFHRPMSQRTQRADIWLSRSADLRSWSAPKPVLAARSGAWWDSSRVGMGPPPIETPFGWLAIYHGVKQTVGGAIWHAGLTLLDLDEPERVLRRSDEWVLGPQAPYEMYGHTPNRVFPTGLVHDIATDELRLYYGATDTSIGVAIASLSAVLDYVMACPHPRTDHSDYNAVPYRLT